MQRSATRASRAIRCITGPMEVTLITATCTLTHTILTGTTFSTLESRRAYRHTVRKRKFSFINVANLGYVYYGWTNESQTWECGLAPVGAPLGIMYGTLPASLSRGAQNLSFLAVGVPDYDPTTMQLPPTTASWHSSAWSFFNTPPSLLGSAGSWNGIPSPCVFRSVGRMLTIAQNTSAQDGSCFGACQGSPVAR